MKRLEEKKILVFRTRAKLYDFLIQKWREISEKAMEEKGIFTVALSGGETPIEFYQRLAGSKNLLAWDKTHIFLADERFVPFEHQDSNYGMIRANLQEEIAIPEKNIHPIPICPTLEDSAKSYEDKLKGFFQLKEGDFPEFDLILLGIGEDGHTASLFPGDSALFETHSLIAAVHLESARHDRVTLTFPVINRARNIAFLVLGQSKARIIKNVLEKPQNKLPASMVRPLKGKVFYLLDNSAGSLLSLDKTLLKK